MKVTGDGGRRVRRQHPRRPAAGRRPRRHRRRRADRLLRPGPQARRTCGGIEHPRLRVVQADLNDARPRGAARRRRGGLPPGRATGVRRSWGRDFDRYAQDNVVATQRLLEAALRAPRLRRFVYASSSSVYGNALRFPTEETDRPQPLSPYGVTKLAAEHLCSLYAENYGLPTVSLRYFTVYGPRQRPDMAFTRFCRAVRDGAEISVFGTGRPGPRLHVRRRRRGGQPPRGRRQSRGRAPCFNVAGGTSTTVNEVLELLGRDLRQGARRQPGRAGSRGRRCGPAGAPHAIRAATGWTPASVAGRGARGAVPMGRCHPGLVETLGEGSVRTQ